MTPKEQEIAIGELEERVDRLRNIYEQYFLGFEKLEPTVPRKDVDRRFAILRKEQIRNTAMRFRFQVVTQKYNTYAMHWVRICRQIEEGTYKRHVRRAKARFGDVASAADRDREISIDIDMDDFENTDFDDVLAEANAVAETYERDAPDTLPPPASVGAVPMSVRQQMVVNTPGTSFAVGGRGREALDEPDRNTPMPPSFNTMPDRTARGAALPPGAKPRVLRKREDADGPPSGRTIPGAPPVPQIATPQAFPSQRMPTTPTSPAAFHPAAKGSVPRIQPRAAPPASAPNIPNAPPSGASAGAHASGRIPVAAPLPPGSSPRLPVAAPAPSAGRIPAAQPPPMRPDPSRPAIRPSGSGPAGKPSSPGVAGRPVPPPAPSNPQSGSGPARPPMPSVSEHDTSPPSGESRPSVRPRPSLPLPSQIARPKKP